MRALVVRRQGSHLRSRSPSGSGRSTSGSRLRHALATGTARRRARSCSGVARCRSHGRGAGRPTARRSRSTPGKCSAQPTSCTRSSSSTCSSAWRRDDTKTWPSRFTKLFGSEFLGDGGHAIIWTGPLVPLSEVADRASARQSAWGVECLDPGWQQPIGEFAGSRLLPEHRSIPPRE